MIEEMKTTFSLSYACLVSQVGLRYRTLMRWKRRLSGGLPAVWKRGPKKVRPLNLNELKAKIRDLDHGPKRSHGTGKLHDAYGESISRRELNALVIQARNENNHRRKAETCRVSWLRPNLAWAVDDCSKSDAAVPGTLHLHNLTDLCSRYKLPPIASGSLPCGEEVAGHLAYLFDRFLPLLSYDHANKAMLEQTIGEITKLLETRHTEPKSDTVFTIPVKFLQTEAYTDLGPALILWLRLVIEQQTRKRRVRQTDAVLAEWLGTTRKTVLVYKRFLDELGYLNIDTSTRPQKLSVRYFPK
jgi:hypothetical protein